MDRMTNETARERLDSVAAAMLGLGIGNQLPARTP